MNSSDKTTTYLSTALIVGGFILIALAWNGSASTFYVDEQIPFVVSGAIAGIGMIVCGCTLAAIQELRRAAAQLGARIDAVARTAAGGGTADVMADTLPEPRDLGTGSQIIREDESVGTSG